MPIEKQYWDKFMQTGRIADYLAYCSCIRDNAPEVDTNAEEYQSSGYPREEYG